MKDVNILTSNGVNVQQSLELFGDMEMYDETLQDFLGMIDNKLKSLDEKKTLGDMANYAIEVHALKSDAKYLGFVDLAEMAYNSEMKSKAGDVMFVQENHPRIIAETKRMIEVAKQYLGITGAVPAPTNVISSQAPMPAPMVAPLAAPVPDQAMVGQAPLQAPGMGPEMQAPMAPGQVIDPQMQPVMVGQPVANPQMQPVMAGQPAVNMPVQQPVNAMGQPVSAAPIAATQVPTAPVGPQPAAPVAPSGDLMDQAIMNQGSETVQFFSTDNNTGNTSVQFFPADNPSELKNVPVYGNGEKEGIILIVDDSILIVNFVKRIFEKKYDVLIAADGAAAIQIVDDDNIRKDIKACLLDLNMPNVNGFEVLEHFKQKGYFVRMPVAIESAVEDSESIEKASAYPVVDILTKPFNERDIQRVIEKCLATYF